jgi:hypothetical protein
MIIFDLQLPDASKVKVLFCVPHAQFLLKAYVSRYRLEELSLIVLSRAHVHVRVDSHCQKTVISLDRCAKFELRRVWALRYRALIGR